MKGNVKSIFESFDICKCNLLRQFIVCLSFTECAATNANDVYPVVDRWQ